MVDSLFLTPHYLANPYPIFASIRTDTPAYQTSLPDGTKVYLVTRYADVLACLRDARLVKNVHHARADVPPSALMGSNMLFADPPEHTRLRSLAHEAFTPKFVNQLRGHIQAIAEHLLDAVQEQGNMDLISAYAFPLPVTVITEMLGVPTADAPLFHQWSSALIASGTLTSDTRAVSPEVAELMQYLGHLVQRRAQVPQDDLISAMMRVEQHGDKFTQAELISTAALLLIAGHETTVNLIGNGTLALLQHPDQLAHLQRDPHLIKPAVEELLRYVNPVQYVNRFASEELDIGGVQVAQGSRVLLLVAAANHDPALTDHPEQMQLARGNTHHVAFGQGIHYCLGAPLARLEGEIAFTTLLRRLPHLRLATEHMAWKPSLALRGLQSLPVTF
jgi:cytochrome P450